MARRAVRYGERGATLTELLVVLVIVSILAVTAVPLAEKSYQRRKEFALQDTLRTVRTAIDAFHQDWTDGRFDEDAAGVSENGYPETLGVLVEGMEITIEEGDTRQRRYLRRLPENPFASTDADVTGQWRLIGYAQAGSGGTWNREDVYDLRARTDKEGLDGTAIADW